MTTPLFLYLHLGGKKIPEKELSLQHEGFRLKRNKIILPLELITHWKMLLKGAEYLFLEVYKNRSDFSSVEMQRLFKMD